MTTHFKSQTHAPRFQDGVVKLDWLANTLLLHICWNIVCSNINEHKHKSMNIILTRKDMDVNGHEILFVQPYN